MLEIYNDSNSPPTITAFGNKTQRAKLTKKEDKDQEAVLLATPRTFGLQNRYFVNSRLFETKVVPDLGRVTVTQD